MRLIILAPYYGLLHPPSSHAVVVEAAITSLVLGAGSRPKSWYENDKISMLNHKPISHRVRKSQTI